MIKKWAFLLLLIVFLSGCKKLAFNNSYPKTSKGVTSAFLKEVEKGNFVKAEKYTSYLKFNGASYDVLQLEIDKLNNKLLIYPVDTKNSKIILDAREKAFNRAFICKKINGKWKIVSTFVEEDVEFKDLLLLEVGLEQKNVNLVSIGANINEIKKLNKIFKNNLIIIKKYPKMNSIFQKSVELKAYIKGTNHGAIIRCYGKPAISTWTWKIVGTF